jgi:hypothetical protein
MDLGTSRNIKPVQRAHQPSNNDSKSMGQDELFIETRWPILGQRVFLWCLLKQ